MGAIQLPSPLELDLITSFGSAHESFWSELGCTGEGPNERRGDDFSARLRELIHRECSRSRLSGIVGVETVIPRTDGVTWLRAQTPHSVKMYWADRDGEHEVAGVGAADLVLGGESDGVDLLFGQVHRRLEAGETVARYFGGMRFNGRSAAG